MMSACEEEKRLHRCCFTGHRPEKLGVSENKIKQLLSLAIDDAIKDGYVIFIVGMARGVDLWAGEIVLQRKQSNTNVKLICATPYSGFEAGWKQYWRKLYTSIASHADYRVAIGSKYSPRCFQKRNEWMVNHSSLVIAVYNGYPGGTRNTIFYAEKHKVHVKNVLNANRYSWMKEKAGI